MYTDKKNFSGKTINRPARSSVAQLPDIENGTVDKIWSTGPISRSVMTLNMRPAVARGVHFNRSPRGLTLDDSHSGTVMAQIAMVFAQFRRETIQRRVTDYNYFARYESRHVSGRPATVRQQGETTIGGKTNRLLVADPVQSAMMASLYARYTGWETLGSLVRWLNAGGRYHTARGGSCRRCR